MKVLIDISKKIYTQIKKPAGCIVGNTTQGAALESIVKGTVIPDNATNGDTIEAMFPNVPVLIFEDMSMALFGNAQFDLNWWNAPYKRG